MKYTYKTQEKALDYLIKNSPHDIEKFRKLYDVEVEGNNKAKIFLRDILFSNVWSAEEKVQLIKLYGHENSSDFTYKTYEREIGYSVGIEGLPLIDECIKQKNYSGVEALLSLGAHISVATIIRIIKYIDDPNERYKFCKLIIDHYEGQEGIKAYRGNGTSCYLTEIPNLSDRYPIYSDDWGRENDMWRTFSSMEYVCDTNDLELVKLFLPTIKNIKPLLSFAVNSKNIEMVKLFIEAGADVNFQDLEFENDNNRTLFKTPLKIAIDNNDLEMVKFLHQNGANLDFVDKSERMQQFISNLGETEEEKQTHKYENYWDRHDYIIWTKTPLEYAINLGLASITNQDLINNSSTRKDDSFEKQIKDRMEIVRYLYENGATFGDGKINYTDLICFAIKSDDFESTKYFFDEALKSKSNVDFSKIIDFIHSPGVIEKYNALYHYKYFEEGAYPWFKMCEVYSKKLDNENHNKNVKLLLEKIFNGYVWDKKQFNKYKEIIAELSNNLPREIIKEIPAVFGVHLDNIEEILSLGYDINCTNSDGINILMKFIRDRHVSVDIIDKLISLGVDVNFQNNNGKSALSYAINKLPKWDFEAFINNFNRETGKLYLTPEEYDKDEKAIVKKMIDLSNKEIIMSDGVEQAVYLNIEPGYPQIIYNEILQELSKRDFKVEDWYVKDSILFLNRSYSSEYITNPWSYLWNLYSNFSNKSIGTNYKLPNIKNAKEIKRGTKEYDGLVALIKEHINRNFATSIEQVDEPNKIVGEKYNIATGKYEDETNLEVAQNKLLHEISRYFGNVDYHNIIDLIDNYPIINTEAINMNMLLPIAMRVNDVNLCKELVKRGATIVCYDENGHDVTSQKYKAEYINLFKSLNKKYNPNSECEDLLAEIGCGQKVLSMKKKA